MNALAGTGGLIRLALRRDRLLTPLWVIIIGLLPITYVTTFAELYPTAAGRKGYADINAGIGGLVALYGDLHGSSLGELAAWRAGFTPVIIGVIAILMVIRHTRTEEESGRRELLGATVTGRHAGLAAALLTTGGAMAVMGALLAGSMASKGLPAAGSWAFGLEFAAIGWLFAAVGGLAAQLTSGAGSARGIALAVLGGSFLLRAVGDLSGGGLSLASPIGWVQRLRPYDRDDFLALWPAVLLTVVLVVAAVMLSARRDVGAGLLPARLGPAEAAASLRSPLALAWRLHRGLLLGWTVAFVITGVLLGGIAKSMMDLLGENKDLRNIMARMGGQTALIDAYLSSMMGLLGLIAAAYAIQATLRLRTEEGALRAEPVLAAGVGRLRWAGSHLAFSLLGPAAVLLLAGLSIGLAHGLNTGEPGREALRSMGGALVQLPAVWVLAGVAVALVGILPRLAGASWGALTFCLLFGLVGAALQLDPWLLDISPFTHLPKLPGGEMTVAPLLWLTAIALGLVAAGLAGLRRRDIPIL